MYFVHLLGVVYTSITSITVTESVVSLLLSLLSQTDSTFLSAGTVRYQKISCCSFVNVTTLPLEDHITVKSIYLCPRGDGKERKK